MRLNICYLFLAAVSLVVLSAMQTKPLASQSKPVPKEVAGIAGTFKGEWAMFGIDEKGEVVKRFSWTDVIKAENPTVKDDRAFVTITDDMTFTDSRIPPRKTVGSEGYLLNRDGSLGDYFFETSGQLVQMKQLRKDIWAYSVPANVQELAALGFSKVISGEHTLVKVVSYEQGVETHRISRLTTVNWQDREGKDRWIQFISLQGTHKKQP